MSSHWRVFLLPALIISATSDPIQTVQDARDEYLTLISTTRSGLNDPCSEPSDNWYSSLVRFAGVLDSQLVQKIRETNTSFTEQEAIAELDLIFQPLINESFANRICIPVQEIVCYANKCVKCDNIPQQLRLGRFNMPCDAVQKIAIQDGNKQPPPIRPEKLLTEPDKKQLTQANNRVDELRQTARKSGKNLGDTCEDLSKDAPSSEVVSKYSGRNGGEQQVKELMRDQPGSKKMSKAQALESAKALLTKLSGWLKNYQENGCDVKKALVCKDGKCAKCEEAGPTLAAACKEFQKLIDPEGGAKGSSAPGKAVGVVVFVLLTLVYSLSY